MTRFRDLIPMAISVMLCRINDCWQLCGTIADWIRDAVRIDWVRLPPSKAAKTNTLASRVKNRYAVVVENDAS